MTNPGNQPVGFGGPVTSFATLAPDSGPVLRLPGAPGAAPAAQEPAAALVVEAVTESMGPVERAFAAFAQRLCAGGTLVVDVENRQSLPNLRRVLEGRVGSFDPAGSFDDPSQALPLRRVLAAAASAGIHVQDVVRVPAAAPEVGPGFAQAACAHGLLPFDWATGVPAARFWLLGRKQRSLGGTVVIGVGDRAAQAATEAGVRAFLPADWEVVRAEGDHEAAGFDRAIARAEGELLWFLRAGASVGSAAFAELSLLAPMGPAAPAQRGERSNPGDISGLMLARNDALLAGPIAADHRNSQIAFEAWNMRLEALGLPAQPIECALASPPPPVEAPNAFADEARALLAAWQPLLDGRARRSECADAVAGATPRSTAATPAAPWVGRAPRITLCMIARNEERFLAECLRRAAPAVDEIVVVDTGSTDRTVAIAESFGAKVLHEAWSDDFAAPRNTGLRCATGDWILVLDADEMLTEGAAERIRALAQDASVAGYHLRFTNMYTGGKTVGVMMVRLFRNLPGIEYRNVIHEQVTPSLLAAAVTRGLGLSSCDVEVEHWGYTDEVMQSRNKNERNERLFRKQLERHPDDIYSLYKYGDFLRRVPGRTAEARDLLERCFERILASSPSLPRELPYAGEVAALCALECARTDRTARAHEIVDLALRRFLPTPNLHYIAAGLALAAGRNDAAIAHYRRCLAYRGQVLVVPIQDGITGPVSLAGIAQAWLQKGDALRARRLLDRAIAMAPDYEPAQLMLSNLQLQSGDPAAALQTLTAFLARRPDSAGACQQAALILHRLGHREPARRMGERAVALLKAAAADHEAARMQRLLAGI